MRNIATCYSEHAVRVSDSYCSGPLNKSYISPKSTPSIQNVVSCTYKTQISNQKNLFITITWCNKLICQGFFIKISEKNLRQNHYQHGFHQLPKIKGTKLLQDFRDQKSNSITVHWDLSSASFEAGPVPIKGFYIIILVDSKLTLMLGDMEDDPIVQNFVIGSSTVPKLALITQCEHFSNVQWNNQVITKAKFNNCEIEHEIMIKCCPEDDGPRSPVLSVYIDKKRVVKIKRLQWNFRGNQVIFVDGLLVDVMWDVYGWYFDQTVGSFNDNNKSGSGVFMFRIRSGLDSRLWLEEEENKLGDKPQFSLLISASNNNNHG
ncbi:hypothetical protein BVRB_7g160180 [Beta vulgaris subsp. vulgaris]|nr:hypothetical protein BVRB_7g160180 [Beta vulgaris subsp. vulgaris]